MTADEIADELSERYTWPTLPSANKVQFTYDVTYTVARDAWHIATERFTTGLLRYFGGANIQPVQEWRR